MSFEAENCARKIKVDKQKGLLHNGRPRRILGSPHVGKYIIIFIN